jgi:putative (di)nucleoside polyphosphate hydrolase
LPKARTEHPPERYRPCVGIVLINREGLVFIGERRGMAGDNWQMPQGGIDAGEQPITAARRELLEETGVDQVDMLAESGDWHCYEVPEDRRPKYWKDRYVGQCQRWFAFRFTGHDADVKLDLHEPEFSLWRWAPADEVMTVVVSFKREIYKAVLDEFRPFLTCAC